MPRDEKPRPQDEPRSDPPPAEKADPEPAGWDLDYLTSHGNGD